MGIKSVKIRGPYRGPTGYDHHVREFVRELYRQGIGIELLDLPQWSPARLPANLQEPWFETLRKPIDAEVLLHFCMPNQVMIDPDRVNVNYTMYEATRIPPDWVEHSRKHSLVVLPTESSRQAWIQNGIDEDRIRLCPLGVNPTLFRPGVPPLELRDRHGKRLDEFRVRFLNISELIPRKNLLGLVSAWIKATSNQDDAILIIKLGSYFPYSIEEFRINLEALQKTIGTGLQEAAPIQFLVNWMLPDTDMPRLYAAATHYISLSHGEGWDQPMVEAAASGLKLIAPDHSAYRAYLAPEIACLIPSREIFAFEFGGGKPGDSFPGPNWWEPDEEQAIRFIRLAIEGADAHLRLARDRILEHFTWEKATIRLIEILSEAGSTQSLLNRQR